MKEYVIGDWKLNCFPYFDKCTCTNKWKNGSGKIILHNLLEENINQIANLDIKIILGYFKTKEDIYKPPGNGSLFNETNNKRIKMIQFAVSKF